MKKLYILFLLTFSLLTFSQGSINFDDTAKWSATTPDSYGNHTYTDGIFTMSGTDVLRNSTALQDAVAGALGTYSVRLRNNATTNIIMTIASGGVGTFSFQARRWDGTPATDFTVEYSTDNGTSWTFSSTINATVTTDSNWKTINGTINSPNANIQIRVKSNSVNERLMVDDFSWTASSSAPSIIITSPSNGTSYNPTINSVNIGLSIANFNVANGTGDGHIRYSVNGGAGVMKYDTTPISLTSLTPGAYSVFVELVNNSNNPISPAKNATVTFNIDSYVVVPNIAAVRNHVIANGAGKYYHITGQAIVTYARTTRNQKYVQDSSAAILIDDNTTVITNPFVIGDGMTGLKGQTSLFNGTLQLLPLENISVSSTGNVITPEVVTIAAITGNIEAYESELVRLNAVTFLEGNGSNTFINPPATNYNLSDGTNTITFRTAFVESDYIGQLVPSGSRNLSVLVTDFAGTPQVTARSIADTNLSVRGFDAIDGLKMYPNPLKGNTLYLTSTANAEMSVQIFDIVGKEVVKSNVMNNTVNISGLNAGVYIVKVTEEGKTATRKLVIQ
ncbi:T9SS type A sorting domain-containing protein [Flavobacterium proteolyticum]|uniref:T9SS type A sorting domain-containing protein n=1 Tax=Flavobacterium proteolyticum TaxID=2911683 RepID=A0ABR9WNM5_9FLAO|nr:T9SS type A sorting domain-containing protein [Flavobacterium proteolyticum]MBE9575521.1 T9SS type A sorting domain-containing protein [Flavobacterium proteolyticum]